MRTARQFVWVHPDDCEPPHGLNMNDPRDYEKVNYLRECFLEKGFDLDQPALIGYPLNGKIQLLSGTHRHLAAKQAGILLPVSLWLRSDIERMWGTMGWEKAIEDISVRDLRDRLLSEGESIPPYEPINTKELCYAEDIPNS